jgi:uridine phosphorylase
MLLRSSETSLETPGAVPLIERADHLEPSVFQPGDMLSVARRQKGLEAGTVPPVCVLDPDGDLVDHVRARHGACRSAHWACYHTVMWEWEQDGRRHGIVGLAVGGSFAVLVAEQLFASGCELLISVASAGQIAEAGPPPYHILIERSLRDEGTSYHYLPPAAYVAADARVVDMAATAFETCGHAVRRGATWTTDAPFRETVEAVARRRAEGLLAVEMEAASLYAFGAARRVPVLCLAHVTNQLGTGEADFEKGVDNGAGESLRLIDAISAAWGHAG